MSATRRLLVPLLAIAFMSGKAALCQVPMIMGSWNVGLVGGASIPTGSSGDAYDIGWTAGAWVAYHAVGASLSLRAMYSYQRFTAAVAGAPSASINGISGEVVGHLPAVYARPFLLVGGGGYHVTDHSSQFGWHVGGGLAFNVMSHTMTAEARYLAIGTSGTPFHTIPVTLGVVF